MIRDITIGQYYPVDSCIHRLDPRVKLLGTLIYVVSLFVVDNAVGYLVGGLALGVVIYLSRVPVTYIMRGLKPILFLLCFSVALNVFLTPGETVLLQLGFLRVTWEGLTRAFFMGIRLIFLIMGSSLMTFTTTPNQLTDGLETGLRVLKKVGVPVHEIAMMMSIALRFIPILVEETDKIMKAQMARGADFESGNVLQRAKALLPILVPLFISSFRRASDLAMAMEARCYHGGEGRTKMKPLKYKRTDLVAYGILAAYLVLMILLGILF